MGIYGTMMPAFADQFQRMLVFHMDPQVTADYSTRTSVRRFKGAIRQYSAPPTAEGIKIHVPSFQGLGTGNAVLSKKPFLFTSKALPIGDFIEWKKEIYRILSDNIFEAEASICVQGLEKVVGLNGTGSNQLPFNLGVNSFD
jgi:hypothetical protein